MGLIRRKRAYQAAKSAYSGFDRTRDKLVSVHLRGGRSNISLSAMELELIQARNGFVVICIFKKARCVFVIQRRPDEILSLTGGKKISFSLASKHPTKAEGTESIIFSKA